MLDTIRHLEVFAPEQFGEQRVSVIGVGATGSRIAIGLAKLGISKIDIWDPDKIEAHNIPNQAFGNNHVGRLKTEALAEIILEQTGTQVTVHPERVDGSQRLGDVVFLLTDTMASRKEIWERGIRLKPSVKLMIETRMGANSGRVYTINPNAPTQVKGWESTLYGDDVAPVSACGASITVGSTAEIVSGLAVWQLIRWQQIQSKLKEGKPLTDELENELVFSLQPTMVVGQMYK